MLLSPRAAMIGACLGATPAGAGDAEVDRVLALPADLDYGAYLSAECVTCHRVSGHAEGIPALVGRAPEHLVASLLAYRAGNGADPVMRAIAARLGDEEIAALAAHFSTQAPAE